MKPRYFVLTAGHAPESAIKTVESRGHVVIATVLTSACSVGAYGICEVEAPAAGEASEVE